MPVQENTGFESEPPNQSFHFFKITTHQREKYNMEGNVCEKNDKN